MKPVLVSLILLFAGAAVFGQAIDCKKFKNGKFKIEDKKLGTFIITRQGNKQTETKVGEAGIVSFTVDWVDDCTYTLLPDENFFRKHPNAPLTTILTVTIVRTTANSYTQKSTANISSFVTTAEMIKID